MRGATWLGGVKMSQIHRLLIRRQNWVDHYQSLRVAATYEDDLIHQISFGKPWGLRANNQGLSNLFFFWKGIFKSVCVLPVHRSRRQDVKSEQLRALHLKVCNCITPDSGGFQTPKLAVSSLWVCLVHFAKMCKDVNRAFEVLNEVYLQNFFA